MSLRIHVTVPENPSKGAKNQHQGMIGNNFIRPTARTGTRHLFEKCANSGLSNQGSYCVHGKDYQECGRFLLVVLATTEDFFVRLTQEKCVFELRRV